MIDNILYMQDDIKDLLVEVRYAKQHLVEGVAAARAAGSALEDIERSIERIIRGERGDEPIPF